MVFLVVTKNNSGGGGGGWLLVEPRESKINDKCIMSEKA